MITNGTVASGGHSMMTNGTVSSASGNGSMTLNIAYKGGTQRVIVPANVPIVRIEPGSRTLLAKGARVFAIVNDGSALRIVVGKDGATPPV